MLQHRLVAHRGFQKHYPENTMLAYERAIAAGARCVETDVLLSADLQPMLYHDADLRRVSGRQGRVQDRPLAELIALPAHEPQRFDTRFASETIAPLSAFAHWLQQHPEVTAFVEIKAEAIDFAGAERVYQAVGKALAAVAHQCALISFDYAFMAHAREAGWQRCGVVLSQWNDLARTEVSACKPQYIFCNANKVPRRADLGAIEATTVLYEIADPDDAIAWFRRGADMIETFDIGGMIDALAHRAL
ncbi:MAG: glycerophosphodiester phosphodiesterase family protein [Porticoccaceae bacterium]